MLEEFINNYYIKNIIYCVIFTMLSVNVIRSMKTKYNINLKEKLIFKQINIPLLLRYILITLGITFLTYYIFDYISKYININFTNVTEPTNFLMIITSFITTCVFAPITEEIVFKFGLLDYLKNKSNSFIALILSSVVFALLHFYNIDGIILTLLLGLLCGISYLKTNNLIYPIIIHLAFNLYALFGDYLKISNRLELYIGIIFLIVGIIMYLLSNKNTRKKQV